MEYSGPWADVEIPDRSMYDMLFASLEPDDLDRIAINHAETGQVLTFGQLRDQVDAAAGWLNGKGLALDGVLAVVLPNSPEYAIAMHGALRIGAAFTPVNVASSAHEVARQLRVTGAGLVVTSTALLATVREATTSLGWSDDRIVLVGEPVDGTTPWTDVLTCTDVAPQVDFDPATHTACLPMSSGTSGMPKAVRLSHRNLVANMLQFSDCLSSLEGPQSLVAFLPFSHIYALTTNLNFSLYRRYTLYTMTSFQAPLFLQLVATRRPTILFVVPPVATFLSRHPGAMEVPWDSVALVVSGAAPLDRVVGEALQERLGVRVVQGYGMTELSPVTHVIPVEDRSIPLDTIGLPVANCRMRVVDPQTGSDVTQAESGQWSQPGELWVKGPNAMQGYLDAPDDSAAVLDVDGWVHTGDLVQVRSDGVTKVVDRLKELIKRRGFQVAPAELEALLNEHPLVADSAVFGIDHGSGDQIPHALLVLAPGADPSTAPTQVLGWLNAQTAQYKHVHGATVLDALPRSAAGKILRRALPGAHQAAQQG